MREKEKRREREKERERNGENDKEGERLMRKEREREELIKGKNSMLKKICSVSFLGGVMAILIIRHISKLCTLIALYPHLDTEINKAY